MARQRMHRDKSGITDNERGNKGASAHMTLSEVGEVLGMTAEAVRQIEASALKKLRAVLARYRIYQLDDLI